MDAAQKVYEDMYRDRMAERRMESKGKELAAVTADDPAERMSVASALGCGGQGMVVHPSLVVKAFEQGQRLPSNAALFDETEFLVPATLNETLLGEGIKIDGCLVCGRNLCPLDADILQVNRIVAGLNSLVGHIGAAEAHSGGCPLHVRRASA